MTSRRRRRAEEREVKDRLIQARVPENLEKELKREAKRRRLSVSHLVRNVLEDTLKLVDTVVTGAEEIVETSVGLAGQVARDASKIGDRRGRIDDFEDDEEDYEIDEDEFEVDDYEDSVETPIDPLVTPAPAAAPVVVETSSRLTDDDNAGDPLEHILAWNDVLTNKSVNCARCNGAISKGSRAYLGVSATPGAPTWLCTLCIASL